MEDKYIEQLKQDLQRLFNLLDMKTTEYNIEAIVGQDDELYLLEVAARAGGSLIPQMIDYTTGVNTVPWIIKAAAGDSLDLSVLNQPHEATKFVCNYMLHANDTGRYICTTFDKDFERDHLVYWECSAKSGEMIHKFRDAQDGFGELMMKFDSVEQMQEMIPHLDEYIHVEVEK